MPAAVTEAHPAASHHVVPRAGALLAGAALVAVLALGGGAPGAAAVASGAGEAPPRPPATCAYEARGAGSGGAVLAPYHCADRLRLLAAALPEPPAHAGAGGQLAAAPGSVITAAGQLPAQGAALAGTGLVLLGIARHIRKSR